MTFWANPSKHPCDLRYRCCWAQRWETDILFSLQWILSGKKNKEWNRKEMANVWMIPCMLIVSFWMKSVTNSRHTHSFSAWEGNACCHTHIYNNTAHIPNLVHWMASPWHQCRRNVYSYITASELGCVTQGYRKFCGGLTLLFAICCVFWWNKKLHALRFVSKCCKHNPLLDRLKGKGGEEMVLSYEINQRTHDCLLHHGNAHMLRA